MAEHRAKLILEDVYKDRELVEQARRIIAESADQLRADRETIAKAWARITESKKRLQTGSPHDRRSLSP